MSAQAPAPSLVNPRRYHDCVDETVGPIATNDPVCLYLETTNRCNLLCTTCPRTYAELEPPAGADEQTRFLAFLGRRV